MRVVVLKRTPGAEERGLPVKEWKEFCHSKEPTLVIHHVPFRSPSRWTCEDNKRPFRVTVKGWSWDEPVFRSATLANAIKGAQRYVKDREKRMAE